MAISVDSYCLVQLSYILQVDQFNNLKMWHHTFCGIKKNI